MPIAWFFLPVPPRPEGEHGSGEHKHGGDPKEFSDGVVLSVRSGSVTLEHGPIYHLGLGSASMTFAVAGGASLEGIGPGAKVRFQAGVADGVLTVMKIERVR